MKDDRPAMISVGRVVLFFRNSKNDSMQLGWLKAEDNEDGAFMAGNRQTIRSLFIPSKQGLNPDQTRIKDGLLTRIILIYTVLNYC